MTFTCIIEVQCTRTKNGKYPLHEDENWKLWCTHLELESLEEEKSLKSTVTPLTTSFNTCGVSVLLLGLVLVLILVLEWEWLLSGVVEEHRGPWTWSLCRRIKGDETEIAISLSLSLSQHCFFAFGFFYLIHVRQIKLLHLSLYFYSIFKREKFSDAISL